MVGAAAILIGLVLSRAGSIVSAFQRNAGRDTRQKRGGSGGLLFTARSWRSQLGMREASLPCSVALASLVAMMVVFSLGDSRVISPGALSLKWSLSAVHNSRTSRSGC